MASAVSVAIRRDEAMDRVTVAIGKLLGNHGLTPSQYTGLSKDPEIAQARMLEAIANDLEALDAADKASE